MTPPLYGLALSPDGRLALSADMPGGAAVGAALWDIGSGNLVRYLEPHQDAAFRAVAFSPDGKQAVAGCWYGLVGFWDIGTGKRLRTFRLPLAFSADGKRALAGGVLPGTSPHLYDNGALLVWDVASGTLAAAPAAPWLEEN